MADAINPSHYKKGWSDDAELISVTENLTSNGGQAVQYIARATRLDPKLNKGKSTHELIQDLEKAQWFIAREVKRLRSREYSIIKDAEPDLIRKEFNTNLLPGGFALRPIHQNVYGAAGVR